MICMIINNGETKNCLYITRDFCDAHTLLGSVTLNSIFKKVVLFETRRDALNAAASKVPEKIFIDSDIGLKPACDFIKLKLKSKNTQLCVYEEGIGTYRTDIIKNKLKKAIYHILGASDSFGGSPFTDRIYVFNAELYKSNHPEYSQKTIVIPVSLASWVVSNKHSLENVFGLVAVEEGSTANDVVSLYLTGWQVDFNLIKNIPRENRLYVKPHPHISGVALASLKEIKGIKLIPGQVPAELLIALLMEKFNKVQVYHHNSSSVYYMGQYFGAERLCSISALLKN